MIITKPIIIALVILIGIPSVVFASAGNSEDSDLTAEEEEIWFKNQGQRPATNEDFDPDESCLFDVFQLKCIPGSEQECPEGFSAGDPEMCFPNTLVNGEWKWECPKDYHSVESDETGQCYPDEEGCPEGMVWRDEPEKTGHTKCHRNYD